MIRRRFLCAAPALFAGTLVAAPACAGEGAASSKQVGQYVDLQPVGLPVILDGQVVNYVFVNVRLNLAPTADTSRWRAKEPFFRDALVRLGFRTNLNVPGDAEKLDATKLSAGMMLEAATIAGPGVVRSVQVTAQTPSHRVRRPS